MTVPWSERQDATEGAAPVDPDPVRPMNDTVADDEPADFWDREGS